jgi:hypothetical protein
MVANKGGINYREGGFAGVFWWYGIVLEGFLAADKKARVRRAWGRIELQG